MDANHSSMDAADAPACPDCERRERRIAELQERVAELEQRLAAASRSAKRQAAPFSKGPPKPEPKRPGRKPGGDYGTKGFRKTPPRIDEVHEASLPAACTCGGHLHLDQVLPQYQTEIPRQPIYRQFNVAVGHCERCGRRVQGRHPLQTSDALGCCASQLGPDAQAAIVELNKMAGLSHGKISQLFGLFFGIPISRGGVCQAMLRVAGRCLPYYHDILRLLRRGLWIVPDETGWRIGGQSAWLHAFVGEHVVAYLIALERGHLASSRIIPMDYSGYLVHDGFASYNRYWQSGHQTCNAHLIRRCREMLETCTGGAVIFPRKIKALLQEGLAIRDRRDAGEISAEAAAAKADELEAQLGKLTETIKSNPANERLSAHVYRHCRHVFPYLRMPGLDATNYRAEQALRPAVVNRKVWGGNRTENGAAAQSILMSVLQTLKLQGRHVINFVSRTLRSPHTPEPLVVSATPGTG